MRRLGERLASAGERSHGMPRIQRRWAKDIASLDWDRAPGWRPVIVIVSYLLASPTLDAVALVAELDGLLTRLGRGPVTVLYMNAIGTNANRRFPDFRAALHDADFVTVTEDTGVIETQRHRRTAAFDTRCFSASDKTHYNWDSWDEPTCSFRHGTN